MEECCAWEQTGHRSPRRAGRQSGHRFSRRCIDQDSWQDYPQQSLLVDVLHAAPRLLELISPNQKKTLLALCTSTRRLVHAFASKVSLQQDDSLQHLLDTAAWPRLQVLELRDFRVSLTAIKGLNKAPLSAFLTSLTLSNCRLNSSTISMLAAGDWPMLQHLSFRNNRLGTTGIKAMAGGKWPCLEHLDLSSNKLNAAAITALTQLSCTLGLLGLEVHDNPDMDVNAVQKLASGRMLFLKGLGISGGFTLNLFAEKVASAWPHLESVYLESGYCPAHVVSFTGVWPNLQNLQIKTCEPARRDGLPKPVLLKLNEAEWPKLHSLDLSYSHLSSAGFRQLALGEWPLLSKLDVSHIRFCEDKFKPADYAEFALGSWPQLTDLCLSHNGMNNKCAAKLISADWPKLQVLDLSYNDIGVTGSASLAKGRWPDMEHLCLHGNKPECMCPCCILQDGF